MALMDEKTQNDVREILDTLTKPVTLVMFTQDFECQYCRETRGLLEELAELSDKVGLEIKDFVADAEDAEAYQVDKIPAVAILDEDGADYGIRFYGIPSGYEFSSLLEGVKMVGGAVENPLSQATIDFLNGLESPLDLQVFVTPTCPYCPRAVVLAHYMALASQNVTAAMIEATEFPQLSMRHNVMGVPRTVINDDPKLFIEGAAPEPMVLERIREALNLN